MESATYTAKELKTVEVISGNNRHSLKIPSATEIRLKHGLFLSLDLETSQFYFSKSNLDKMKTSQDVEVRGFMDSYGTLLESLAASNKL